MRIWKLKKMAVYFQGEKAIEIGKLLASLEQNSRSFLNFNKIFIDNV